MSWEGKSGWFVVIYYCMGRVIDDVVGGLPSLMVCIEVTSDDIIVVVE